MTSQDWCPTPRSDVVSVAVDDDLVILDGDGKLHVLNASAAEVWATCDGNNAVRDIVAVLGDRYGSDRVGADIASLLADLHRLSLII